MGGWEEAMMEREATKGCKLIRFLSLHAPLPVLFLSNPGGQCCAAQRLNSQTQWGNNCYMQHLAAETLSVIPNDTFLFLLSQLSLSECRKPDSKALYSLFHFFLHPFVLSEDFHILTLNDSSQTSPCCYNFSSVLISFSSLFLLHILVSLPAKSVSSSVFLYCSSTDKDCRGYPIGRFDILFCFFFNKCTKYARNTSMEKSESFLLP